MFCRDVPLERLEDGPSDRPGDDPPGRLYVGESMKRMNIVWGILLIGIGLITLMQTMGVIVGGLGIVWAFVFAAVGATFLWTFITDRSRWWALIPAFVLLSLAATAFLEGALPETSDRWTGAVFMGGLSLSFWAVYLVRRDYWWAIIPGGVLLTIAVVAAMPGRESLSGGIFFLGLALTFGLVFLLTRMMWAIIPAAVLAVIGGALAIGQEVWLQYLNYVWPVFLIAAGLYLIVRVMRRN